MSLNQHQHRVNLESGRIERVLQNHEIEGRVVRAQVGRQNARRTASFDVAAGISDGWQKIQELQRDLRRLFSGFEVQLSQVQDRFQVNIQRPASVPVDLMELLQEIDGRGTMSPLTAVLGWSAAETPVLLDLHAAENHHILISGVERAGKTALVRTMIISLALFNRPSRMQFIVAAPARGAEHPHTGLHPLSYLPHLLLPVLSDKAEIEEVIGFLLDEANHRLAHGVSDPEILFALDDSHLVLNRPDQKAAAQLAALARLGEGCGIHLLVTTRYPEHPALYDLMEAYLPVRIAGKMASSLQAEIATDTLNSEADMLLGEGDFLAAVGERLLYFQAAFLDDIDLHFCLEQLHRSRPPALVARELFDRPAVSRENELETLDFEWSSETGELEPAEQTAPHKEGKIRFVRSTDRVVKVDHPSSHRPAKTENKPTISANLPEVSPEIILFPPLSGAEDEITFPGETSETREDPIQAIARPAFLVETEEIEDNHKVGEAARERPARGGEKRAYQNRVHPLQPATERSFREVVPAGRVERSESFFDRERSGGQKAASRPLNSKVAGAQPTNAAAKIDVDSDPWLGGLVDDETAEETNDALIVEHEAEAGSDQEIFSEQLGHEETEPAAESNHQVSMSAGSNAKLSSPLYQPSFTPRIKTRLDGPPDEAQSHRVQDSDEPVDDDARVPELEYEPIDD